MGPRTDWKFIQTTTASDLDKVLPKKLASRCRATISNELVLLDDFCWQIWQAGLLLTREATNGLLQLWQADGNCLAECPASEESRFWWQLPEGELAERLKAIISLHAYLPKYRFQLVTESLEILNLDEKIVCRCQLYRLSGEDGQNTCFVTLLQLRGYAEDYREICSSLATLDPVPVEPLHIRQLLLESGLQVEPPQSSHGYQLSPEQPAETAVCKMVLSMLQTARQYEQGLLEDIDTEFVHQYRVNIRKSRSLVSLFKKTLSPQRYLFLKNNLKILGSRTNDLRDLDVFLLDEQYYREMLPENLQVGLTQLFSRVKCRRASALKKVVTELGGADYQAEIGQLLESLQAEPEFCGKHSRLPIRALVCKKVLAQYQQIFAAGKAIQADTPDEAVHDLRIECKKLRYLLELFSELFARKKVKQLIRQLKTLQDNLGRFNDFAVQREFLVGFAQGKTGSQEQLASINGLAAVLFNKQLQERGLVLENIVSFSAEAVEEQFQQLFAISAEEAKEE